MRILITRPKTDALPLTKALGSMGHEGLITPLLDIHFYDFEIDSGRYRGVLATSANGVRALARCSGFADIKILPLYAVGPATAEAARHAGFAHVETAGGDVVTLSRYIEKHIEPGPAPLLHVSGKAAAGDLQGLLGMSGFIVERKIGYEARKAKAFPAQILEAFGKRKIDAVLLYSPRTAAIFCDLIRKSGLENAISNISILCLSEAVSAKLADLSLQKKLVAQSPDQGALLDLVQSCSQDG